MAFDLQVVCKIRHEGETMKIVLFVIIAIVLLCIVSGVYTFFAACLRRKELPWLVEEEIKQTPYGKYYDYISQSNQWLVDHSFQEITTQSYDGLTLYARWVPAEKPRGTVLFAHGYRSTVLVDVGTAFEYFHNLGMNLLIPDHRSHGKSEGKYITFGVKESRDMVSWMEYHNQHFGDFPIVLDGVSMGAATVMYVPRLNYPPNLKAMIADCGFTSPKDIISVVFRNVTHLPAIPSIWIADLCARLFAGFGLYECDSRKTLKDSQIPIVMAHGTADDFVPCEMSKEGFAACKAPKELLLAKDAGHGLSFLKEREKYVKLIEAMLNHYVGPMPQ